MLEEALVVQRSASSVCETRAEAGRRGGKMVIELWKYCVWKEAKRERAKERARQGATRL